MDTPSTFFHLQAAAWVHVPNVVPFHVDLQHSSNVHDVADG
jgi:hypothetical protein